MGSVYAEYSFTLLQRQAYLRIHPEPTYYLVSKPTLQRAAVNIKDGRFIFSMNLLFHERITLGPLSKFLNSTCVLC